MKKTKFKLIAIFVCVAMLATMLTACKPVDNPNGPDTPFDDSDPTVTELIIETPPTKTEYHPGEEFNPAGMKLVAKWSHGIDEDITPGECTITPKGALEAGMTSVTLTYEGKSCAQAITVKNVNITGISLDSSAIASTQLLGTLDLTEIKVRVHYDDESSVLTDLYTLSENGEEIADPVVYTVTKGTHTITVTYGDYTKEFSFTALDGYIVDTHTVVGTSDLESNREAFIGKNFVEKTAGSNFYYGDEQGFGCLKSVRGGDIMRFHIWSEFETNVELILTAAGCYHTGGEWNNPTKMEDMQFNRLFVTNVVSIDPETNIPIKENGSEVKASLTVDDDVILPGCESETGDMMLWVNFVDVSFGEITLNKGDNIIEIEVVNAYKNRYGEWCAANISGFKVITVYNEEHEHALVKVNGTPATCVDKGTTDYYRCSVCNRTYDDAEGNNRIFNAPKIISATGVHTPDGAASCTHESRCSVCDTLLATKLPHSFTGEPCVEDQVCSVCGETIEGGGHELVWNNNVQVCRKCNVEVAYKIQAEDYAKISYRLANGGDLPRKTESTTGTAAGWTNQVYNGAENSCVGGMENNSASGVTLSGAVIEITVNVTDAGTYDFIIRGQANTDDGGASDQSLANMFTYSVNDGAYAPVKGAMLASSPVGGWLETYGWNTTVLAAVQLNAGENTVKLKYNDGVTRGPNVDYFVFEKSGAVEKTEAEIIVSRSGGNTFSVGTGVEYNKALPGVHLRILVPENMRDEVGAVYHDIQLTAAMCEQFGFDTSTAGERSMTVTVEKYGKTYSATFDYVVVA